ncbi:MAG: alkyl hydroperoxide reductase subunit F [Sphingomonadaceae bacterium]|nr:alkyl hydroperoxide reductase subunit F [Sphingomonadaceae bacterium]
MLDPNMQQQLGQYLTMLRRDIELVPAYDDSAKSRELAELLGEIAALSDKVTISADPSTDPDMRRPSFAIRPKEAPDSISLRFAGIPLGHEFTSLVLALLQVGGHPPKIDDALADAVRAIDGDHHFETFFALSCQSCPDVVQALNLMSVLNPRIRHTAIDGALFADEVAAKEIMSVPAIWLNGAPFGQGRMGVEEILAKLDTGHAARQAEALADKPPFDVLIVGGGPAGTAAAIYAARKGVATGIITERFGGQVLDTMAIENFIATSHTEGPRLVAQMEGHVRDYAVDIMAGQHAAELTPAVHADGLHALHLASGAILRAKTIILSTGARWRQMGVPGEEDYRNKGVAYCPHCDGPLFKGKRVAVVGGGNSGVEAAIDLAGLTQHVTLIEFEEALRADQVLQDKLRSLPNVSVILGALTKEVLGDGNRVTGLAYEQRSDGSMHQIDLDGVFVQIGLMPNSEWLDGAVALSPRGEIEVDARGATSAAGIFAAGDATTTPYKQIIIAMGEGAKAALSAFDHLIRLPG